MRGTEVQLDVIDQTCPGCCTHDRGSVCFMRVKKMWTGAYLCGRVWMGKFFFFNSYVSQSPVRRTAQSALHVMLLSYYIGI